MTEVWVLTHTNWSDRTEVLAVTFSEEKADSLLKQHALENNETRTKPNDPRYEWEYTNGWYCIVGLKATPDD